MDCCLRQSIFLYQLFRSTKPAFQKYKKSPFIILKELGNIAWKNRILIIFVSRFHHLVHIFGDGRIRHNMSTGDHGFIFKT